MAFPATFGDSVTIGNRYCGFKNLETHTGQTTQLFPNMLEAGVLNQRGVGVDVRGGQQGQQRDQTLSGREAHGEGGHIGTMETVEMEALAPRTSKPRTTPHVGHSNLPKILYGASVLPTV